MAKNSKKSGVRMKDIARDLGVSVVTVSKVLRGHDDISPATRDRVLERMRELNYKPNLAARSLVTGRSYMVGLVVPDLLHPFFAEIAKVATHILRPKGYCLVIASSEENPELEVSEIEALLARQVDAIILASVQASAQSPVFKCMDQLETPYVLIDRNIPGLKASFVGVDDEHIGYLATRHLIEHRCRSIAHIGGPNVSTAEGRLRGFRKALAESKLEVPMQFVERVDSGDDRGEEGGYKAMLTLLSMKTRPDGVFCYNDETAIGALRAAFEAGLEVPADLAVIGVGNMRFSDLLRVPLSSIDQNSQLIGDRAARIALQLIEAGGAIAPESVLLPVKLIQRESSSG